MHKLVQQHTIIQQCDWVDKAILYTFCGIAREKYEMAWSDEQYVHRSVYINRARVFVPRNVNNLRYVDPRLRIPSSCSEFFYRIERFTFDNEKGLYQSKLSSSLAIVISLTNCFVGK